MLWVIWSLAALVAGLLYYRQVYTRFSKCGVKHYRPVPFVGNMTRVLLHLEHFVDSAENLYKSFPNEKFVGTYEFGKAIVVINDLELIKRVTVKDFDHFLDHRPFMDEEVEPLFGNNLFSLKGQKWKDMRSTLSPAFTSSKIRLMVPFMDEAGPQVICSLKKEIEVSGSEENGVNVDCKDLLSRYANDVIASCAFGLKVDSHTEKNNEFYKRGKIASQFTGYQTLKLFAYAAFPNLAKKLKITLFSENSINFFKNLVMGTMANREKYNINRNDMIHLLMEARKGKLRHEDKVTKDTDAGFATVQESGVGREIVTRVWSDDEVTAQAILFFIAGFETVSITMTFLLFELAINTDVQNKLAKEIRENYNNNNGKLDYSSIQSMVYLDMVVSEVLRKWPPAIATDRVCTKYYNLGKPNSDVAEDYFVREGEAIMIPIWAIQRSPTYYPEPEKFDPERFSVDKKHNIKPYTYMPFGVGPRNCIGSRFALCEIKVLIYHVILHMEVTPSEKTRLPIKLTKNNINLIIKGGHWLRFKRRY